MALIQVSEILSYTIHIPIWVLSYSTMVSDWDAFQQATAMTVIPCPAQSPGPGDPGGVFRGLSGGVFHQALSEYVAAVAGPDPTLSGGGYPMESHGFIGAPKIPKTNFGPQCMHQISCCFNRESQGYVSWFWDVWGVRMCFKFNKYRWHGSWGCSPKRIGKRSKKEAPVRFRLNLRAQESIVSYIYIYIRMYVYIYICIYIYIYIYTSQTPSGTDDNLPYKIVPHT